MKEKNPHDYVIRKLRSDIDTLALAINDYNRDIVYYGQGSPFSRAPIRQMALYGKRLWSVTRTLDVLLYSPVLRH